MAEKLLTDRQCKAARPKDRIYYKSDGNGLRLQIRPEGAKYWMLRYTLGGNESTAGLGPYPEVGLDEARRKAAEARKLIAEGINPSIDRKVRKSRNIERSEATFESIAGEWLARNRSDWSSHHHERNAGLLRRILLPDLGSLPITEISEPLLLSVLKRHYDSGIRESARRARQVAQQVFAYAKDTHRATHNPARELARSSVVKKPEVKHFAALKSKQVGPLLRKLDASAVDPVTKAALVLMLYTGLRDSSLRSARWHDIDLKVGIWTVPRERMKSGREFRAPLPRQGIAILKELGKLTHRNANSFVFTSRGKEGFLAENTLRLAMHGLGFKVTAHGIRSLLTDLLNEREFNSDAIERQLDHAPKDAVRASYLRSDFFDYRKKMMQWLADWVDAQRSGVADPVLPSNVVALRRIA